MLGNCEKMVLISSSANQWPQMKNHHPTNLDHDHQNHQKGLSNLMASSSSSGLIIMDKQQQQQQAAAAATQDQKTQQQQQQEPLRCPRCDSSNTKFCYYNNYSLSQPRHFCKACKRYWTRGGTLRNVPVGGGCRRNKRLKRPTSSTATATATASAAPTATATHSSSSPVGPDSTSSSSTSCANNNTNPLHSLFYGSSTSDLNLPFSGYDHHHHLNALGLGFSSANIDHRDFNLNGFNSNSLLSGYSSTLFANPSSTSISSLLASKFTNGGLGSSSFKSPDHHHHHHHPNLFQNNNPNLASPPFDHHHHHHHHHVMGSNGGDQLGLNNMKDHVKLEDGMKRLNWDHQNQTTTDEIVAQSNDPNSLYANWPTSQTWNDPTNLASSITSSLI